MRNKVIGIGAGGFLAGVSLGWVAALIKVITQGDATWSGDVRVLFIPVARVTTSAEGFTVASGFGLLVLGALCAVAAGLVASQKLSHKA